MSFVYYCPYCSQKIRCEDEDHATKAPCPTCGRSITVWKDSIHTEPRDFAYNGSTWNKPVVQENTAPQADAAKFLGYTSPSHKTPVLSTLFIFISFFHLLLALLSFAAVCYFLLENWGATYVLSSIGGIITSLLMALIWWGIAQVIIFIGKTSDNSEAIRKLLEMNYLPRR